MLIRDLDYLHGYPFDFNEDDGKGYIRGGGPNDFSWITANVFDSGKSAMSEKSDARSEDAIHIREFDHQGRRAQSPGVGEEISENKQPLSLSQRSSDERIGAQDSSHGNLEHKLPAGDTPSAEVGDASINQHQRGIEKQEAIEHPQNHHQNETNPDPTANEARDNRCISDTWSVKEAHAVVSVMTLYVNGVAQKIGKRSRPIIRNIGHVGSDSNILEITVAYKMLVIPKDKVDWKNFLIPAEMADVSAMLNEETKQIWGHSGKDRCECSQSLCDLGLSRVDLEKRNVEQGASGRGQTAQDPGIVNSNAQRGTTARDDTIAIEIPQPKINEGETLTPAQPSNSHEAVQTSSAPPVTGAAVGISQKLSSTNQIEYLMWRHTEHILSVCTIPLSVPHISLAGKAPRMNTSPNHAVANNLDVLGIPNRQEIELEVPLALTCGDMSGHRICTSASL